MPYYQKRPVVVKAEVLQEDKMIPTLEGDMLGRKGHYLITGVQGEQYPCKPDIFHQTYIEVPNKEGTCFVYLCIDFDGVLHAYTSGWKGADVIPDPPVNGAIPALYEYLDQGLTIAIHSARSAQPGGIEAMQSWLNKHDMEYRKRVQTARDPLVWDIEFPMHKPAAQIYMDDRGLRFNGPPFPSLAALADASKVWYRDA